MMASGKVENMIMSKKEKHQGGCLCGKVRYETDGSPERSGVCHCRYCQLRTGSSFGIR